MKTIRLAKTAKHRLLVRAWASADGTLAAIERGREDVGNDFEAHRIHAIRYNLKHAVFSVIPKKKKRAK